MDYFELNLNLSEEDLALKKAVHKFAAEVMRPIAIELDKLTAEEVIADGSPLWEFLRKAYEQGYHCTTLPQEVGGGGLTPLQAHIVNEELGWGSFGLSVLLGVAAFPFNMIAQTAALTGDMSLLQEFVLPFTQCKDGSIRGCWAITEPDHGSDIGGNGQEFFHSPKTRYNIQTRLDGDEWVINGQKSAWVSGGTIATHALLFGGVDPSQGMAGGGIFFVPLDRPGVSKGKPLEKMGQRDLNQGEIFFDNVRIPKNYLLIPPEAYVQTLESVLANANAGMGNLATGLARAAFEEAFNYAKVRVQGGQPIIEHVSMRQRLFDLFSKVETCRALSRAVLTYNYDQNIPTPLLEYGSVSKVRCTQMAFEVASEAIQILGGNGLTREYLTEKLFRDARATLIEDGNNEMLAWAGGKILAETYPRL